MSIVLNEHDWAEEMIRSRSLGKKPSETLCRVARYYIDKEYSKKDVRKILDAFLLQCDPVASLPKWANTIDYALARALKYEAIQIDKIDITDAELEIIDNLDSVQTRRLAFTLLCLAKYWNAINKNNSYWVNNKDSEIMKLANINTSIKRQSAMYHTLNECGLIEFSKKVDNTNVRVCFIKEGNVKLSVTDFRNLGYQYLKYRGEPYFECQNCGIVTKINNPARGAKPKYCRDCAVKVRMQQNINSVMKRRG